mmetsp:Transcript_82637/g.242515  ORF Transcript_82637/g.242515 Transcript_82637/m.242515 type:complete len:207 (-) Transcript_82637:1004-1624(-)
MDVHVCDRWNRVWLPRARRRLHRSHEGDRRELVALVEPPSPAASRGAPVVGEGLAAHGVHEVHVADPGLAHQRRPLPGAAPGGRALLVVALGRLGEPGQDVALQVLHGLEAHLVQEPRHVGDLRHEARGVQAQLCGRCRKPERPVEHGVVRVQLVAREDSVPVHAPGVPVDRVLLRPHGEDGHVVALVLRVHLPRADDEVLRKRAQ